jgi:ABC-type Mn2+/Zn2+ transport system permease subunit
MASSGYGYRRRERAPKPLSIPITAMLVGAAIYVVGLAAFGSIDTAALGVIVFVWGLTSSIALLVSRRIRARRAARSGS